MAKKRKVQKMVLMGNKGNGRTYSNKHEIPEDFGSGISHLTIYGKKPSSAKFNERNIEAKKKCKLKT